VRGEDGGQPAVDGGHDVGLAEVDVAGVADVAGEGLELFWRLPDWAGPRARRAPAGQPTGRAAAAKLLAFMSLVITWRLPAVRNALAADPVLALAELVTLAAAG
jgi:hypothetical protein